MTTEQIENCCICEINAMIEGWRQRYYDAEDLAIIYSALPVYNTTPSKKKPPSYEDFIAYRNKGKKYKGLSLEQLEWLASEE